ncbi:MAG TPA: hypothetical protein VMU56_02525, partial [Beijerinckiaceae bacterium]|nr:hypothetical protein [Beijerinckiaceae bacterium]
DKELLNTPLEKLKIIFIPKMIVFANGKTAPSESSARHVPLSPANQRSRKVASDDSETNPPSLPVRKKTALVAKLVTTKNGADSQRGATEPKMSSPVQGALDSLIVEQYRRCWKYLGLDDRHRYFPMVRVNYRADGGLADEPSLLNPPSDPSLRGLAKSALDAVHRCNPLKIPAQYAPYFNQWKARIIRFDPAEMAE